MVPREGVAAVGAPRRAHSVLVWAHLSLPSFLRPRMGPPTLWALQTLHGPSGPCKGRFWLSKEASWRPRLSGGHRTPFDSQRRALVVIRDPLAGTGGPLANTGGPLTDTIGKARWEAHWSSQEALGVTEKEVFTRMLLETNFSLGPCIAQNFDNGISNVPNCQLTIGHLYVK